MAARDALDHAATRHDTPTNTWTDTRGPFGGRESINAPHHYPMP